MQYDLDILEEYCQELGFSSNRSSPDSLEIKLMDGVVLEFHNLRDPEDTLIGFSGTPWHCHGNLMLNTSESTYVELDELDVLKGIKSGKLLIFDQYRSGSLHDRWIAHNDEKMDVQHIEPGEEIHIRSLA